MFTSCSHDSAVWLCTGFQTTFMPSSLKPKPKAATRPKPPPSTLPKGGCCVFAKAFSTALQRCPSPKGWAACRAKKPTYIKHREPRCRCPRRKATRCKPGRTAASPRASPRRNRLGRNGWAKACLKKDSAASISVCRCVRYALPPSKSPPDKALKATTECLPRYTGPAATHGCHPKKSLPARSVRLGSR